MEYQKIYAKNYKNNIGLYLNLFKLAIYSKL